MEIKMASLMKNVGCDLRRLALVRDAQHRQKSASAARIWPALRVTLMLIALGLVPVSIGALGRFMSRNPVAGSLEAVVEWSMFKP
jgi:hypothetical protein